KSEIFGKKTMKTIEKPSAITTPAFCRQRLTKGTNFLDVPQIRNAFGAFEYNLSSIPAIPFIDEEIERAIKLNQFLVLHTPITMKAMHDQFDNKLGDGKLFYNVDWYSAEPFYTTETTSLEWKLVGCGLVPDSTGLNYVAETQALADYVSNQVYADMEMPAEYQEAIDELKAEKVVLEKLINGDKWKEGGERVSKLKFNQLFRGRAVENIYNTVAYHKTNGEYLLPAQYARSRSHSSLGTLVRSGYAGSVGMRVYGVNDPRNSSDGVGVWFSRSGVVKKS
ncbi:MAG: hypothetical protein AAB683_01380, partial [Patescibacteria group bacterium]